MLAPFDDGNDAVLRRAGGAGMLVVEPLEAKAALDEWVSTWVLDAQKRRNAQSGEGIPVRTFRRILSPTRGAHCRPLDPRLASLRSEFLLFWKIR